MNETVLFIGDNVKVSAAPYRLNFKFPFKLALNTRSFTNIVILKISRYDIIGYGEAALPPYLGATVESTLDFYKSLDWNTLLNVSAEESRQYLDLSSEENNAAKASISIALNDLHCLRHNITLGDLYNVQTHKYSHTTYTIGISTERELLIKLKESTDFKIHKLKLGSEDDKELIKAYKRHCRKPFCVDVNQGYKTRDKAAEMGDFLLNNGALFIEQPLPLEHFEEMAWVRDRVEIPFIADESVKRLKDLDNAAEAFSGVNIKLMKSAGISEALDMIAYSRKLDLKVVLGAMAESSLGNTAAAHFASLADWVDLDGPLLTSNNPFDGITYKDGAIILPNRAGVGIIPSNQMGY